MNYAAAHSAKDGTALKQGATLCVRPLNAIESTQSVYGRIDGRPKVHWRTQGAVNRHVSRVMHVDFPSVAPLRRGYDIQCRMTLGVVPGKYFHLPIPERVYTFDYRKCHTHSRTADARMRYHGALFSVRPWWRTS